MILSFNEIKNLKTNLFTNYKTNSKKPLIIDKTNSLKKIYEKYINKSVKK